jgi:hypothetical protein
MHARVVDHRPTTAFHTVSEGEFCELRLYGVLGSYAYNGRVYRGSEWDPEMRLGEAFTNLGQALERIRGVSQSLRPLASITNDPAHQALLESVLNAQEATEAAYDELVFDPNMPQRGEWALAEYCRRRGYSALVVEGSSTWSARGSGRREDRDRLYGDAPRVRK